MEQKFNKNAGMNTRGGRGFSKSRMPNMISDDSEKDLSGKAKEAYDFLFGTPAAPTEVVKTKEELTTELLAKNSEFSSLLTAGKMKEAQIVKKDILAIEEALQKFETIK